MMDRNAVAKIVQGMYSARVENSVERCASYFSPDAKFILNGEEEPVYQLDQPAVIKVEQKLAALIDAWEWQSIENLRVLIDGNKASTMYTLTAVFNPNGETIKTVISDHITVTDQGAISEFVEFIDTAMVQSMVAAL